MCLLLLQPYRINILRLGWVWFWQFAMEWRAATPIMRRQRTLRRSVAASKKQHFSWFFYVVVLKCENDDIFGIGRTHKLRSCVAENPSELLLEALVRATAGGNYIKQEMSSDILGYLASQVCSFSDKRWGFNDSLLVCWLDPTIPLGHPKDYGQPAIWYNSAKYNNRTNVAAFFKLNEKSDFGYYGNGDENEIELQRWYSYSVSSLRQNGKVSRVLILCSNWIYVSSRYF